MKFILSIIIALILFGVELVFAQGKNHNWLIGYDIGLFDTNVTSTKARLYIDSNNQTIYPQIRKMAFRQTQGNISDESGNLIISSNGCWIANANGDTMMNGSGLNTGALGIDGWCTNTSGLPVPNGSIVLPFPGDSNKYILFHQTLTELYYSIIDISLDGGLGSVTLKNEILSQTDSLIWGLAACKHANGRDWWLIALRNNSNVAYKYLISTDTIHAFTTQVLSFPIAYSNACQPTFSPDGSKFAYVYGYGGPNGAHDVRIMNFDRCTGDLDSLHYIPLGGGAGFGLAYSTNSQYLYHSSYQKIYQVDLSTFIQDTVAINDGYCFPYSFTCTDFWSMYLAANGKIYISSGNGVIDMHFINNPDNPGLSCDVQQHAIRLPCYYVRGNVNHPNYYLGPVLGSVCDTLGLGIDEVQHDFHFTVTPNPSSGEFKISYMLPQNEKGKLEIFDINGRRVYEMNLPQWSTMQYISLPEWVASGIYNCVISSGGAKVNKKLAVINH